MDLSLDIIYGKGTTDRVSKARVLVVGAGGVGCELLKNLATAGFRFIELIDLDVIDVSNLNRQFLFRKHHVNMPKSTVAAEQVTLYVPGIEVVPKIANIKDKSFDVQYFQSFDIVLNALDNADARRHVNRMCLAANVPMVESGSTGYLGQVTVVKAGETECYDCKPQNPPKSYAVCTIRSTPEKPEHCIVWAKFLFSLLFGPHDDSNLLADLNDSHDKKKVPIRWDGTELPKDYVKRVGIRIFRDDIQEQHNMKELWENRNPPICLNVEELACKAKVQYPVDLLSQRTWTLEESAIIFEKSLEKFVTERVKDIGHLTFDKDDDDVMSFVAAVSNLRASAYHVSTASPFTIKGIAGNIIHAIATTNAAVAGMLVLETIKVISDPLSVFNNCTTAYILRYPAGNIGRQKLILNEKLAPPNPDCYVCSKQSLKFEADLDSMQLLHFVDEVARKHLGVQMPTIEVTNGNFHNILYESGEGLESDELLLYEQNGKKSLKNLNVESGAIVDVSDYFQNFAVSLYVQHNDTLDENDHPGGFQIIGKFSKGDGGSEKKRKQGQESSREAKKQRTDTLDDKDAIILMEDDLVVVD